MNDKQDEKDVEIALALLMLILEVWNEYHG